MVTRSSRLKHKVDVDAADADFSKGRFGITVSTSRSRVARASFVQTEKGRYAIGTGG